MLRNDSLCIIMWFLIISTGRDRWCPFVDNTGCMSQSQPEAPTTAAAMDMHNNPDREPDKNSIKDQIKAPPL